MVKKWHFKSSLSHSWIEWSRNGCTIFENVCSFGRRQHISMTKSCQKLKIQCVFPRFIGQWMHQMAPSPSQKVRQEHAGTVMHATVVTHALWVTHAVRVAHAARVPTVPTYPPPLRIRSPRGPPKGRPPFPSSLFLGYLNLGQWTGQPFERSVWLTDHTLLHSLLGAMFNWRNCTI